MPIHRYPLRDGNAALNPRDSLTFVSDEVVESLSAKSGNVTNLPEAKFRHMHHNEQFATVLQQDARLVQIVDSAFADSASRSGEHLVCRPGCTQCCHGAFAINPLDALRLRAGMVRLSESEPGLAAAIEIRAQQYLREFEADFPGDLTSGMLGTSEREQAAFEEFANDAACPALNPESGLCDLYSARPMTCRVFGPPIRSGAEEALAVCELCFTEATAEEVATCEMAIPHEDETRVLETLGCGDGETIVVFCLVPAQR